MNLNLVSLNQTTKKAEIIKELRAARTKHVAELRGYIIHHCIAIENSINNILKHHFCGSDLTKQEELYHIILVNEGFNFGRKKEIIYYILENYYKARFDKIINVSTFKAHFEELIKLRNDCAHRYYDPNDLSSPITLKKPKTKNNNIDTEQISFDTHDIKAFAEYISTVNSGVLIISLLMGVKN